MTAFPRKSQSFIYLTIPGRACAELLNQWACSMCHADQQWQESCIFCGSLIHPHSLFIVITPLIDRGYGSTFGHHMHWRRPVPHIQDVLAAQIVIISAHQAGTYDFFCWVKDRPPGKDRRIIYCTTIALIRELSELLHIPYYTSRLNDQLDESSNTEAKNRRFNAWCDSNTPSQRWMIMTLCFSEGIDFLGVHYVIHVEVNNMLRFLKSVCLQIHPMISFPVPCYYDPLHLCIIFCMPHR
jgi:hypothetical protein